VLASGFFVISPERDLKTIANNLFSNVMSLDKMTVENIGFLRGCQNPEYEKMGQF
jgi:hypothetical protein